MRQRGFAWKRRSELRSKCGKLVAPSAPGRLCPVPRSSKGGQPRYVHNARPTSARCMYEANSSGTPTSRARALAQLQNAVTLAAAGRWAWESSFARVTRRSGLSERSQSLRTRGTKPLLEPIAPLSPALSASAWEKKSSGLWAALAVLSRSAATVLARRRSGHPLVSERGTGVSVRQPFVASCEAKTRKLSPLASLNAAGRYRATRSSPAPRTPSLLLAVWL